MAGAYYMLRWLQLRPACCCDQAVVAGDRICFLTQYKSGPQSAARRRRAMRWFPPTNKEVLPPNIRVSEVLPTYTPPGVGERCFPPTNRASASAPQKLGCV